MACQTSLSSPPNSHFFFPSLYFAYLWIQQLREEIKKLKLWEEG
jgi:hypothetical protein